MLRKLTTFFKNDQSEGVLAPQTPIVEQSVFQGLPLEMQLHVFSFFQIPEDLKSTKKVSKHFRNLSQETFKEYYKQPGRILESLIVLAVKDVIPFIEAIRKNLELNFADPYYTIMCKALITTDIKTINATELQDTIDIMAEKKEFVILCNTLRITKAAIDGNLEAVESGLRKRSSLMPYVNLSGANLAEIDLSKVDLTKVNLQNANLQDAELEEDKLVNAYLEGANLACTRLDKPECIMQ